MKNLLLLFLLLGSSQVFSQHSDHDSHKSHEDNHGLHHHPQNEIGIALSPVYFVAESEFAFSLHLHYVRNFKDSRFGYGLAYERIFDEHGHNFVGIVASYRPILPLSLNISPGISFEGNEVDELGWALHFETSYEFEIGEIHIGPLLEYAIDEEDQHISLGLHLGYAF